MRCVLRDTTRGELRVDIAHRRVQVWDGEEEAPRCWYLVVRREVKSEKTIKYSVSNAPVDTPLLLLAQMQGNVTRSSVPLKMPRSNAGWRSWHHHVTMVMQAMLFIAEQRVAHQPGGVADTARYRRDAEGDTAAQAARQGRPGRQDQPPPRTQTRRHRVALPHSAQGGTVMIPQKKDVPSNSTLSNYSIFRTPL
jgi:hypothetical protein